MGGAETVCYEGIVPCGRCLAVDEPVDGECPGGGREFVPCQICHFLVMGVGIVEFFLIPPGGLLWIAGLVFLALAGMLIVLSQVIGNPDLYTQAMNILKNTLTGLVLALVAWIVVNTIFLFIGVKDEFELTGGDWAEINCPIDSNTFKAELCE